MAKTKKHNPLQAASLQNPVAKFMRHFNKAQTYQDKTRYQRKSKHKNSEPFPMHVAIALERVPV